MARPDLELAAQDQALLGGELGSGAASAMEILTAYARATGAPALLDITSAHIDGCLYHGAASLDFVEHLAAGDTKVSVPTTLNVGSIDLIHPDLMRLPTEEARAGRRLMELHEQLGCLSSFTCAPYQTLFRPRFGEQIAWGESNAIVFANSVIGARTNRYGDFIDLCCAITGRAPANGLHLDENRLARAHFRLRGFSTSPEATDTLFVGVGLIIGRCAGDLIPVIEGLPPPRDEDQLKALGAAAASAGSVALFHATGVTPEASDLAEATGGLPPLMQVDITPADIADAVATLSAVPEGAPLAAVCLGTPHFSHSEWQRLFALIATHAPEPRVPIYVNTGRATLQRLETEGALKPFAGLPLIPVADTCTYVTTILENIDGAVMTNSGKWAHYAPGNMGCDVAFGDLRDCVISAARGTVTRGGPVE